MVSDEWRDEGNGSKINKRNPGFPRIFLTDIPPGNPGFKEAFDFYEVEYEITPLEETCEVCGYPSRQVIVLGRIVEYYGQRNGFLQLAKKYNFETKEDLSMAPFLIRDGMDAEKAVKLQQELTNIGIRSQVIRSGSPVTERKRKKFFQRLLSSEV